MKKYCSLLISALGIIVLIVAVVLIFVVIPPIIDDKIVEKIVLEEGTEQWDRFMIIPQPLDYKIYFFNILNPDEVQKGRYPEVKQVGPYIYKMHSEKSDVNITSDGDEIEFKNKLRFEFDPVASAPLTENDELLLLHLPMNTLFQVAEEENKTGLIKSAVDAVFDKPTSMFIKTTPREYLFDGLRFCKNQKFPANIICSEIERKRTQTIRKDVDKSLLFSFFYHKNNTDDGVWTIYSGKNDIMNIGQILKWNGEPHTKVWMGGDNSTCNKVQGTDSTMYSPFRHGREPLDSMWVFNSDICRSVSVHFKEKRQYNGIPTFRYEANEDFIAQPKTCYCLGLTKGIKQENGCLYDGALELKSCQKAPVVLTHPHFMYADDKYKKTVTGLDYEGDKDKYVTYIESDPYTGTPIKGSKRVQFNMFIYPIKDLKLTTNLPTALVPVLWVDEGIALNQENIDLLNSSLFNNLLIVDAVTWALVGVGAAIGIAGFLYYSFKS